jgi:hypothetical protein
MPNDLEQDQSLRNGKDRPFMTLWPSTGLANTNPIATAGSTTTILGAGYRVGVPAGRPPLKEIPESLSDPFLVIQAEGRAHLSGKGGLIVEARVITEKGKSKPAGQIILFKKIMEDWGFEEQEAAILMGLEDASDIRDIYDGKKPIGNRDASDRLRAILRIAADLDALYRDIRAIRDWMNEPQRDLGGVTPHSLLQEGSMENLLRVKYYVSHLSGR